MTGKIHIAGEPTTPLRSIFPVQRCTRCHTDLNQGPYSGAFWPIGLVYKDRYGAGTTPNAKTDYRDCKSRRKEAK